MASICGKHQEQICLWIRMIQKKITRAFIILLGMNDISHLYPPILFPHSGIDWSAGQPVSPTDFFCCFGERPTAAAATGGDPRRSDEPPIISSWLHGRKRSLRSRREINSLAFMLGAYLSGCVPHLLSLPSPHTTIR